MSKELLEKPEMKRAPVRSATHACMHINKVRDGMQQMVESMDHEDPHKQNEVVQLLRGAIKDWYNLLTAPLLEFDNISKMFTNDKLVLGIWVDSDDERKENTG